MSGANAVLIERGTDMVLYQTFREAGYADEAIRQWIVQPAHQNWELMGNMCCFGEPISMELLKRRSASAQMIIGMLRSLGITPVLRGYYGIVPDDFTKIKPSAHVIKQGNWVGFVRPGWLDPRDPEFGQLAESFYRHQRNLYGDSTLYDMEVFQEGGTPGDVPVGPAAKKVQEALEQAHPGALWMLMAWGGIRCQNYFEGSILAICLSPISSRAGYRASIATRSFMGHPGSSGASGSSVGAPRWGLLSATMRSGFRAWPANPAVTLPAQPFSARG
jgi:alpha-N-acetylglucosaminidase